MNATPRMKALFASSAALLVFGVIIPANANPDGATGRPAPGTVGQADGKEPPGQQRGSDENGYRCDGNQGAGQGNPAHGTCTPATIPSESTGNSGNGGSDGTKTNNAGGNSHDNSGGGSGAGKGDVQDYPGGT